MGGKVTLHETITDGITVTDEKHPSHQYSERARRHLWLQMSRLGAYDESNEIPIMVRGEGTRVYDANGTEYFDGLAGLFTNSLGHGRRDIGDAAAAQMGELGFFPLWTYASS
jgi:adenosylmethionine-8-amino-7-oxononanoate aminotransferase